MKRILQFIISRLPDKTLDILKVLVVKEQFARAVEKASWSDILKKAMKKARK